MVTSFLSAALALIAILGLGGRAAGAQAPCDDLGPLTEKFLEIYPTGGPVRALDGERAQAVMYALDIEAEGARIVFLYSGDGPATGARGRYLYAVLDAGGCIVARDWIKGRTYDRALGAE